MTQESSPRTQHDWTVHSINIHGIFFERWCQQKVIEAPGWTLDSVNYPVEFPPANGPLRGKESALDIRASRMMDDVRLTLLTECKKCNPDLVNWVFFEKPVQRSKPEFIVSQVQIVPGAAPGQRWGVAHIMRTLSSNFTITDEARETRAGYLDWKSSTNKTKTSNAAIQDAAYQVSLAKQAIVHQEEMVFKNLTEQPKWRCKTYFPVIVTTARLFVAKFDAVDVDPASGEIPYAKASIEGCDAVVFEYTLPPHLQFGSEDFSATYNEGFVDTLTRLHTFVVQSEHFPKFLRTFHG
jgi:hypothetical protein